MFKALVLGTALSLTLAGTALAQEKMRISLQLPLTSHLGENLQLFEKEVEERTGGAIDVDACRKTTSFMVLCDSFNIPLVLLIDQPGFLIGLEGEKRWAPGRIMNWMNALLKILIKKSDRVPRRLVCMPLRLNKSLRCRFQSILMN